MTGATRGGASAARVKPALLIDAHAPGESGLGRYTREMLRALVRREDFRAIYAAGAPAVISQWCADISGPTVVHILPFLHGRHSPLVPLAWSRIEAQVPGPRVSWFPHWDGAWSAAPGVMTVHDLIHLDGRGLRGRVRAAVARAWIGRDLRHASAVVTGSEHAAAAIAAAFPAAHGKLTAIHHGVASVFFTPPRGPRSELALRSGLPQLAVAPYLLTVGNKRPHKRFETAIRAFARLAGERPALQLVMVGSRDAHTDTLRRLATALRVDARVHDLALLDDPTLAMLYANAEALLVTSQVEGFGLIAVEAMAAGTPVVAVDREPFPEVLGGAGLLVPYDDDAAMADALRRLPREAMIAKGRARAAGFTWERAAERLAGVLVAAAR